MEEMRDGVRLDGVVQLFEYPSQRFQDWLSQRWVMATGKRVELSDIDWLHGPFGEVDTINEGYIERLAQSEGLCMHRRARGAGIVPRIDRLVIDEDVLRRLNPRVAEFYERTADYDLDVWSEWSGFFGPGGRAIHHLYSRRLQQLNLPQRPLDVSHGVSSEIIQLRAKDDSEPRHVIWLRTLRKTGQIVYVGHYGLCDTPEGVRCCKVVFPLPCGNATVILEPVVHEDGSLELRSCGERFGDPGFYFLLRDRKGRHWTRYIRSMRESIRVYEDEDGDLRTDHVLTLWRRRVFTLHYRIRPAAERVERQGERQTPHPGTRSGLQSTA